MQEAGSADARSIREWHLKTGYPFDEEPSLTPIWQTIGLPPTAQLYDWQARLFASFVLPPDLPPEKLAVLLRMIMIDLHGVDSDADVEIALEYP